MRQKIWDGSNFDELQAERKLAAQKPLMKNAGLIHQRKKRDSRVGLRGAGFGNKNPKMAGAKNRGSRIQRRQGPAEDPPPTGKSEKSANNKDESDEAEEAGTATPVEEASAEPDAEVDLPADPQSPEAAVTSSASELRDRELCEASYRAPEPKNDKERTETRRSSTDSVIHSDIVIDNSVLPEYRVNSRKRTPAEIKLVQEYHLANYKKMAVAISSDSDERKSKSKKMRK